MVASMSSSVCFVGSGVNVLGSRSPGASVRQRRRSEVKCVVAAPVVGASIGALALLTIAATAIKRILDTPSRPYAGSFDGVGKEYDEWTDEGVLEALWGEHIHLGYYTDEMLKQGWWRQNFREAKYRFVDKMLEWGGVEARATPKRILDVGCGFGGTSRMLAKKFPDAKVTGITLSGSQVRRGTELAVEQGVNNAEFLTMDALKMEYEDNTFDLVWGCESGEHMPDKQK